MLIELCLQPAIHGTLNNEDSNLQQWIQDGATTNFTVANKGMVEKLVLLCCLQSKLCIYLMPLLIGNERVLC